MFLLNVLVTRRKKDCDKIYKIKTVYVGWEQLKRSTLKLKIKLKILIIDFVQMLLDYYVYSIAVVIWNGCTQSNGQLILLMIFKNVNIIKRLAKAIIAFFSCIGTNVAKSTIESVKLKLLEYINK